MMGDDLRFAVCEGQRDVNLPLEHHEHIDLPFAAGEQRDFCRKGLLLTKRAQALDHVIRELGECKVRTIFRIVPYGGFALFVINHGVCSHCLLSMRANLSLILLRHSKVSCSSLVPDPYAEDE